LQLELQRKELKSRVSRYVIPQVLMILLLNFIWIVNESKPSGFWLHLAFILLPIVASYMFTVEYLNKSYVKNFKVNIIEPLIRFVEPSLVYKEKKFVSKETFLASKIESSKITDYSGNDFVYGNIDGVNIKFSELSVEGGSDGEDLLFWGLFMVAEFPKHFHAHTIVYSKKGHIGNHKAPGKEYKSIKMDSPEFNEYFAVFSTDIIEARYILSHTLMERIIAYYQSMEYPISISFVDGNIYIATNCGVILEPTLQRSLLDFKIAKSYAQTLHFAIRVVEALKLDLKLWSKY